MTLASLFPQLEEVLLCLFYLLLLHFTKVQQAYKNFTCDFRKKKFLPLDVSLVMIVFVKTLSLLVGVQMKAFLTM